MKEILIAIIGLIVASIPYVWKLRQELKATKINNKELEKKLLSSSLVIDLKKLNEIRDIVHNLISDNFVDRFMLLSSVNGKDPVNFVSVLIEQHDYNQELNFSIGATSKYVDIGTDEHYKSMLRNIEKVNPCIYEVDKMKDGILKSIYKDERVKHSMVIFTNRFKVDNNNDRLIFCSWATHSDIPISDSLALKIESVNNKIKDLIR